MEFLDRSSLTDKIGWNCRLGLDRLAMVLYNIPDIRLLQLKNNDITKILTSLDPNSDTGLFDREVVFLIPSDMDIVKFQYHFYELVRITAEDSVQEVQLVDQFPKTGMVAQRYRITYHSWGKLLSKSDVNDRHDFIKELAAKTRNIAFPSSFPLNAESLTFQNRERERERERERGGGGGGGEVH